MQRHVYGHQGKKIQIFSDKSSLAVNPSYIQLWLDLLSRTPRVAPFLSKNDPLVMALKKVFTYFIHSCFYSSCGFPLNWLFAQAMAGILLIINYLYNLIVSFLNVAFKRLR